MKLSVAAILAFAVVAKAAAAEEVATAEEKPAAEAEADDSTEQNRELHPGHWDQHPHQPNPGCCIFDESAEFCEDPPGDVHNWCSKSEWKCEHKCHGIWSPTCEKKEPGCCYQKWGGGKKHWDAGNDWDWDGGGDWDWDGDRRRNLHGGHNHWHGKPKKGGCSSSCWCNVNEHNCWTCSGHWFPEDPHGDGDGDGGDWDGGWDGGDGGDGWDGTGDWEGDGGGDGAGDWDGWDGGSDWDVPGWDTTEAPHWDTTEPPHWDTTEHPGGDWDWDQGDWDQGGDWDWDKPEVCYDCHANNPCHVHHKPVHHPHRELWDGAHPPHGHNKPGYFPACWPGFFIQCDAHGGCFKMPCPHGQTWNTKANTCTPPGFPHHNKHPHKPHGHGHGHGW